MEKVFVFGCSFFVSKRSKKGKKIHRKYPTIINCPILAKSLIAFLYLSFLCCSTRFHSKSANRFVSFTQYCAFYYHRPLVVYFFYDYWALHVLNFYVNSRFLWFFLFVHFFSSKTSNLLSFIATADVVDIFVFVLFDSRFSRYKLVFTLFTWIRKYILFECVRAQCMCVLVVCDKQFTHFTFDENIKRKERKNAQLNETWHARINTHRHTIQIIANDIMVWIMQKKNEFPFFLLRKNTYAFRTKRNSEKFVPNQAMHTILLEKIKHDISNCPKSNVCSYILCVSVYE